MGRDLTEQEANVLVDASLGKPFAVGLALALTGHTGLSMERLGSLAALEAGKSAMLSMKRFLNGGGEIHLVTNGKNPGQVLAVEHDQENQDD